MIEPQIWGRTHPELPEDVRDALAQSYFNQTLFDAFSVSMNLLRVRMTTTLLQGFYDGK